MTVQHDKPLIANTARGLGVRVNSGNTNDLPVSEDGYVSPNSGGMSVAPRWQDLPLHRIPRRLCTKIQFATGNNQDACWRMGAGPFEFGIMAEGLMLQPDSPTHGTIEPQMRQPLEHYLHAIWATQDSWSIEEE
jgi:hypothetical protein